MRRPVSTPHGQLAGERVDAGIDVYFCDPHAPWQRGSNENTNGLLRQYFPHGTDFGAVTEAELNAVADELNDRPRKRLGFASPPNRSRSYCCTDRSNPPFGLRDGVGARHEAAPARR